MKVWYSDSTEESPLQPLGNGKILAWMQGADLFSLRMSDSAPHLCAMYPEFSGSYHEISTLPSTDRGERKTKLFYTAQTLEAPSRMLCDMEITDTAVEGKPIFRRRLDGISPLCWKLVLPSYVRCVYNSNYRFGKKRADAIFLTIPAGTPMESGLTTMQEQSVVLILCGALRYDAVNSTIYYTGDVAELYFLSADDPSEMIKEADYRITSFSALPDVYDWQEPDGDADSAKQLLYSLQAMTAKNGITVASQREPFGLASDLPAMAEVFALAGEEDRVRTMLLTWSRAVCENDRFPMRLLADRSMELNGTLPDYTGAASYLLAASRAMAKGIAQGREADRIFRGMRHTFTFLLQGIKEGMLPFSAYDRCMEAGILGRELLFQGSAESTALAIAAAKAYLQYCDQSGRRVAHDSGKYRLILSDAEASYEAHFVRGKRFYRNSPALEGLTRRPRFIRSICVLCQQKGAYPFEEMLELDKYGRYLCRRCFSNDRNSPEAVDPGKRYASMRAVAMASIFGLSQTALTELCDYAMEYAKRNMSEKASLPVREGDTDPLILLALWKNRDRLLALWNQETALLHRLLSEARECGLVLSDDSGEWAEELWIWLIRAMREHLQSLMDRGVCSALLCDKQPLGCRSAAGMTALCYLALQSTETV